ncbi:MAG: hypothetical protein NT150_02615 [Bacteroidetes bacterium]|nr:hypothetical protein [Bacteroidota bacterium]
MKKIENDYILYYFEDDILFSEFKKPTSVDLEKAKEIVQLRHEISGGKSQFWCAHFNNLKEYTKEGRDYADVHGQDFLLASAAVVNSQITKFIVNIFISLKSPKIPFKAFKSKEDAVAWLKELKEQSK